MSRDLSKYSAWHSKIVVTTITLIAVVTNVYSLLKASTGTLGPQELTLTRPGRWDPLFGGSERLSNLVRDTQLERARPEGRCPGWTPPGYLGQLIQPVPAPKFY